LHSDCGIRKIGNVAMDININIAKKLESCSSTIRCSFSIWPNIEETGRDGSIKTAQHNHGIKLAQTVLPILSSIIFILL